MSSFYIRKDFKDRVDSFKIPSSFLSYNEVYYAYKKLGFFKFLFFFVIEVFVFLEKDSLRSYRNELLVSSKLRKENDDLKSKQKVLEKELSSLLIKNKKKKKKNNKSVRRKTHNNVVNHNINLLSSLNDDLTVVKDTLKKITPGVSRTVLNKTRKYLDKRIKSVDFSVKKALVSKSPSSIVKRIGPSKKNRSKRRAEKLGLVLGFFKVKDHKFMFVNGSLSFVVVDSKGKYDYHPINDNSFLLNNLKLYLLSLSSLDLSAFFKKNCNNVYIKDALLAFTDKYKKN